MHKYQKVTLIFIMIGTALLTGGFALNSWVDYGVLLGWGGSFVCHIIALVYALKWHSSLAKGNGEIGQKER
jgi:hypothetical protein